MKNVNWKKLAQVAKSKSLPMIDAQALIRAGKITATDLETSVSYPIDVQGEAVVNVKTLAKIKFDGLEISQGHDTVLIVKNGNAKTRMITEFETDDFPSPVECEKYWGTLDAADLENLKKLITFSSTDVLRPVMTGVYFDPVSYLFVSTDAHRLAWYPKSGKENHTLSLNIPAYVIKNFFTEKSYKVFVATKSYEEKEKDGKEVINVINTRFVAENGQEITTRNIDGKFPNYQAVVPQEFSAVSLVPKNELLNALKVAENFTNESTFQTTLTFQANELTIHAEDLDYNKEYTEKIPMQWNIADDAVSFAIGFNVKLMQSIINTLKTPTLEMLLFDHSRAILINRNNLLMPVMLNS